MNTFNNKMYYAQLTQNIASEPLAPALLAGRSDSGSPTSAWWLQPPGLGSLLLARRLVFKNTVQYACAFSKQAVSRDTSAAPLPSARPTYTQGLIGAKRPLAQRVGVLKRNALT